MPSPPATPSRRAFRWHLRQPLAIGGCAALGAWSGWTFRYGDLAFAWLLFLFGFVWVLIVSMLLGLSLAFGARTARGEWRAALHVGFASAFPTATAYLAFAALLTLPIELRPVALPNGQEILSRPDWLRHAPVLYGCSLIVGAFSGPLWVRLSPFRPAQTRSSTPVDVDQDVEIEQVAHG